MNFLFDLHTHTLASGHAYGSFTDNIAEARKRGLWGLGVSEHSSSMPGAPQPIFFTNFKVIPDIIDGLHIFTGMELNIIDYEGHVDMEERILQKVDYVIASLHKDCIQSGSVEENTSALVHAMKNPYVKILGHPDDDRFPVDYEKLVEAASHEHIAMEINNSSASPRNGRIGAEKNIPTLLKYCQQYQVPVIAGSDAHIWLDVGDLTRSETFLQDARFPASLVLNTTKEGLLYVLNDTTRRERFAASLSE